MTPAPLDPNVILPRIQGIQEDLVALKKTAKMSLETFAQGPYFGDANYRLHRILEGIFNISNHLLSRLPGASKGLTTYRDIALRMGEKNLIPKDFSNAVLVPMAGFRNRLVHGYADITPKEIHDLLLEHLKDVETFLSHLKKVLDNPAAFGLAG